MNFLPQARYLARCRQQLKPETYKNKNCLVVGATRGIGRSIAILLAQLGANVTISGRSNEAASAVIERLRLEGDNQRHSFERVDFTSQKDTKRFIESTSRKLKDSGGLDYLFTSAGKPPLLAQALTEDGIEAHFALQCLGRYSTTFGFAKIMNPDGCISVICAPGGSGSIPRDDCEYLKPENKSSYGILKAANRDSLFMDAILMELSKKVAVVHHFPGLVNTDNAERIGLPWPVTTFARMFAPYVMTDPDSYAVTPVSAVQTSGFHRQNQYGSEVKLAPWTQDADNRRMCIDYAERRIAEALQR